MKPDINAPCHAYNELEEIALKELEKYNASLFSDLPPSVQESLLKTQDEVFAKHGVTREEFNLPEDEPDGSFIVPDDAFIAILGQTSDI